MFVGLAVKTGTSSLFLLWNSSLGDTTKCWLRAQNLQCGLGSSCSGTVRSEIQRSVGLGVKTYSFCLFLLCKINIAMERN